MNMHAEPSYLLPRVIRATAAVLAVLLLLTLLCPLRAAAEGKSGLELLKQGIREAKINSGKESSVHIEKDIVVDKDMTIPANLCVHAANCTLYVNAGAVLTIDGSLFMGGNTGRIKLSGTALVNGGLILTDKAVMDVDGSLSIEKEGHIQIWDSNRLTIRGSLVNRRYLTVQGSSRIELYGSYVNEKNAHLTMEDSSVFWVAKDASYTDEGGLWVRNRTDCGITGEGAPVYAQDEKGDYLLQSELERRREKERKEKEAAQKREEDNAARKARKDVRIQYVDPLTGTSFSAPAGWILYEKDDPEEERIIFSEDSELAWIVPNSMLFYHSLDLWEELTQEQKQKLPREKLDTALFSGADMAKALEVSQSRLEKWTCGGRVYYLYSGEAAAETESGSLQKAKCAYAVCIVNGWLYRYTLAVSTVRTYNPADILKDVLKTAEYSTPAPTPEKGGGLAEWGIGFGIAALILLVWTGLNVWFKRKGKDLSVWKALERAGLKLRKPAFKNAHTARLLLMLLGLAVMMAVEIWLERQGQGKILRVLLYMATLMMVKELTAFAAEARALKRQRKPAEGGKSSSPVPEQQTEEPRQETESADQADTGEQRSEDEENQ